MLLLARLGLRAGEVARLGLDDVDWRRGEIAVVGKGNRAERLPLPAEVGVAIAGVSAPRPPGTAPGRSVFVRVHAPHRALTTGGVTMVVFDAAQRAGLGRIHAHRLRHTAATAMLRAGSPLAEVGQVLRHRSALTTRSTPRSTGMPGGAGPALARRRLRGCVVTGPLREGLADYLALRRALGYRLARPEKLLGQFLDHLEQAGQARITVAAALDWSQLPGSWWLQLVGLPALDVARVRHLPARRWTPRTRCPLRSCCRSARTAPARTCIPTPTSPR